MMNKIHESVSLIDLCSITRQPHIMRTVVKLRMIDWDRHSEIKWLTFGQANLRPTRDDPDGRWTLSARMIEGVTDFEHDSAYALKLPLIGVTFDQVDNGTSIFSGWVDPNNREDFRVPDVGYDPVKSPDSIICKQKGCENHPIINNFVPPENRKLFDLVKGKRISILVSLFEQTR